jgi:hypothetical protein
MEVPRFAFAAYLRSRGGMSLPPGRPKEGYVPLGGTARSARERLRLPPGRPKEGSLPLGGKARSAKGAQ